MNETEYRKMLADWHYLQFLEFDMDPSEIVEAHSHEFDGFALVLEGEITLRKESGNQTCQVGDIVKYPANELHSAKAGPNGVKALFGSMVAVTDDD